MTLMSKCKDVCEEEWAVPVIHDVLSSCLYIYSICMLLMLITVWELKDIWLICLKHRREMWELVNPHSAEVTMYLQGAGGWRSKHQSVLNHDKWMQHMACVSQSLLNLQQRKSWGTPSHCSRVDTKLIDIHNPSLNREHLAAVCTGELATSHNLLLMPEPKGLESHCLCICNQGSWGSTDLWMHTFQTVHSRCCWVGTLRESRAENESISCTAASSGLPCFIFADNPFVLNVYVFQTSTWSPSWAPPFLPRNWWPDYASYWEKQRPALLALLWRTGGKRR